MNGKYTLEIIILVYYFQIYYFWIFIRVYSDLIKIIIIVLK